MSTEEIKQLVSELVEQKLTELLGDPDADRELRDSVVVRLKASFEAEEKGDVGTQAGDFASKLGLRW